MFILLALFFLLFSPVHLHAWGGVTHFYFGTTVLTNLDLVTAEIANIIGEYPYDFLYGMVLADIIVGKKYADWEEHSHNWKVGFSLFGFAAEKFHIAFLWGFISHLAADVMAHNFFLPEMFIRYYHGKMKTHVYWEAKFDTCFPDNVWLSLSKIQKNVHKSDDEVLRKGLKPTLFSFATNKRIFDIVNFQRKIKGWRDITRRFSSRSIYKIPEDRKLFYINRSVDSIIDVLNHGSEASIVQLDPTGGKALTYGLTIKKDLRKLRKGGVTEQDVHQLVLSNLPRIPPGPFSRRVENE